MISYFHFSQKNGLFSLFVPSLIIEEAETQYDGIKLQQIDGLLSWCMKQLQEKSAIEFVLRKLIRSILIESATSPPWKHGSTWQNRQTWLQRCLIQKQNIFLETFSKHFPCLALKKQNICFDILYFNWTWVEYGGTIPPCITLWFVAKIFIFHKKGYSYYHKRGFKIPWKVAVFEMTRKWFMLDFVLLLNRASFLTRHMFKVNHKKLWFKVTHFFLQSSHNYENIQATLFLLLVFENIFLLRWFWRLFCPFEQKHV